MGQAQINVRTRACSRTSIARTRQAALTHNVRGKELTEHWDWILLISYLCPLMTVGHLAETKSCNSLTDSLMSAPADPY